MNAATLESRGFWRGSPLVPAGLSTYENVMAILQGKRILLGVSGGIAAYKTPELVRRLRDAGATVRVILTDAAQRFVTPLALEVVSEGPVGTSLWATDGANQIVHTDLGKQVDLILLAPATANLIGRLRHGLADDLLSTTLMACATPVLLCPAMNSDMLSNPLVAANIDALESLERYTVLSPDHGSLACGVVGPGRLPDPPMIVAAAAEMLKPGLLTNRKVVITAGPTREAIDPVRFISNRSTGTMGFALAGAAAAAGAEVTLIAGPVTLPTPSRVRHRVDVVSAAEMTEAVFSAWDRADALIMTAAVADYRPERVADQKIKKGEQAFALGLSRTVDILARTREMSGRAKKVVVGFAAETEAVEAHAIGKLKDKGLDWIVANDVSREGTGFGTGDNAGLVLGKAGERVVIARCDKQRFATAVIDTIGASIASIAEKTSEDRV